MPHTSTLKKAVLSSEYFYFPYLGKCYWKYFPKVKLIIAVLLGLLLSYFYRRTQ